MTLLNDRNKWDARYRENSTEAVRPERHEMALRWRSLWAGGAMLDAACGLGRGIASALCVKTGAFQPIHAVDLSEDAIALARLLWSEHGGIQWTAGDVNAQSWPEGSFGLICAFGFTDMNFFRRVPGLLRPGGMFLYEGFSARQRDVKPGLNPDWIGDPAALRQLFAAGRVLEIGESESPPFRVRMAAITSP